jgi:tetratricopeptide (TPR) repeat protein
MLSDWFWKRLEVFVSWLLVALLFALAVFLSTVEIKDLDLWLHLGVGRYILSHSVIPQVDFLSCTFAGAPWINHEWLFQVFLASVETLVGIDGLIVVEVVLVGLSLFFLWMLSGEKKTHLVSLLSLLLVLLVYQHRLLIRPDLFSLFFLILYFYVLTDLERRLVILRIFLLQVVWTNVHGFFILGPLVALLALAGEWIKRHLKLPWEWGRVGRLNEEEYRHLKVVALVSFLACFVNPAFVKGALYPFAVLFSLPSESKIFFEDIGELQPLWSMSGFFNSTEYLPYILLFVLSTLSFLINRRKLDIGIVLLWGVMLLFSLKASRNIAFFAVTAYLAIMANFREDVLTAFFKRLRWAQLFSLSAKMILIVFILQYWQGMTRHGYFDFDTYTRKSEFGGVSKRNFPYHAADFLVRNKIQGNFFNDFNSGAYLIGRTSPDIKTFIDGRTEVYGAQFYETYDAIFKGDTNAFEEAVNRYNLTGVFLGAVYVPVPRDFISYLARHPQWSLVYFDYDAVIFLRNMSLNASWIEQHKVDLNNWQPKQLDLFKIGSRTVIPYQSINRAYALFHMGYLPQAKEEAWEALRINPQYIKGYEVLGAIGLEEKDYPLAYEYLRKALLMNPANLVLRHQLAVALYHLNYLEEAKGEIRKILSAMPDNAKTKYLLSALNVKEKKYKEALERFEEAYTILPTLTLEILEVAHVLCVQEQYAHALDVYEAGIKTGKKTDLIYLQRAQCYQKQGRDDLAKEDLHKAAELKRY